MSHRAIGAATRLARAVMAAFGMALFFTLATAMLTATVADASSTIVVNSTRDDSDTNASDGVCATSRGECTLRAAIETANSQAGSDRIIFEIPGTGTRRINVSGTLPPLLDRTGYVEIDGYTQPGAQPNTAQYGSNAVIQIEVRGSGSHGIRITSSENIVRGLSVAGFYDNFDIRFEEADGNLIVGNFIGLDARGNEVRTSGKAGVGIRSGPDRNIIGTPDLADRNVISGNGFMGILIEHGNTSRNVVQNNVIGLNPALTAARTQSIGIDVQWGTWGNLIGGPNPGEGNLISGNKNIGDNRGGIDLSHDSVGTIIIGNYLGTLGDGNTATSYSANRHGILIKDNAINNYIADNVIANSNLNGIHQRHNYSGPSTWVNNRIGIGSQGASLGNRRTGVWLNGHDDVFHGNLIARNSRGVAIVQQTFSDTGTNHPSERTLRNQLRYNTFYGNSGGPQVDIDPLGRQNPNDSGDGDSGIHELLNYPTFSGMGTGEVYGTSCPGCQVQVYMSGTIAADGTVDLSTNSGSVGAAWLATAQADGSGNFSLADDRIVPGRQMWTLAIDPDGNTSEWGPSRTVPTTPFGIQGNPQPGLAQVPAPQAPPLPDPHQRVKPQPFSCSYNAGVVTWTDVGASEYFVNAVTDGNETFLGGHSGNSLVVPTADSYRVTHFQIGPAVSATCGPPPPAVCTSISFGDTTIRRFGGQDEGLSEVVDGGTGLRVFRNGWKAVDLDHQIRSSTKLAFDFRSPTQGEEHAIGVSNVLDGAMNGQRFKLYGTQNTNGDAIQDFNNYPGDGSTVRYEIPIGQYLSGSFNYLVFTADDDSRDDGVSIFSNVELYEVDGACDPTASAANAGGLIAEADSTPRSGVNVDLFAQNSDGSTGQFLRNTQSGDDGRYLFADLIPRCHVAIVVAPEGELFSNGEPTVRLPFCVEEGQTITDLNATIGGAVITDGTLSGTVTFTDGAPAEGVKAVLFQANTDGGRGPWIGPGFTGADGVFAFTVNPGCYVIDLVAPEGATFAGNQYKRVFGCVEAGETADGLDATLTGQSELAAIGGAVTKAGGPVEGAKIDLFQTNDDGSRGTFLGTTRTAGDGGYSFNVTPGCHTLTFIAPEGETYNGSRWFQPTRCPEAGQVIDDLNAVLD